jgi:hypothetical protein
VPLTADQRAAQDKALVRVRDVAADYFATRDVLEGLGEALREAMVDANALGLGQHKIAIACDLSEDGREDHKFHRSRVQQMLWEARDA